MAAGDEEIDALYGLALDEFTSARNDLARDLRKQGDRERADAVAKLPKPSRAAWAVNQLARRHPGEVDDLLRAGEELRAS